MTDPQNHTSCAFLFDGSGRATQINLNQSQTPPKQGFVWAHLVHSDPQTADWKGTTKLPPVILAALTADEKRPRDTPHGDGAPVISRGFNLNDFRIVCAGLVAITGVLIWLFLKWGLL